MSCQGARFSRNPFHVAPITQNDIGVVINQCQVRLVELCGKMRFSHCQPNRITNSLSERSSCNFYAEGFKVFGVSRGFRFPLTELFNIVDGDTVIASQIHQGILQHTAMPRRQHKAIAVKPFWVLGVKPHELIPKDKCHWSCAHWQSWVTRFRFFYSVDRQKADGINTKFLKGLGCNSHDLLYSTMVIRTTRVTGTRYKIIGNRSQTVGNYTY